MEALRALLVPALLPELCFEAMRERPLHGAGMGNGGICGWGGRGAETGNEPPLSRGAEVGGAMLDAGGCGALVGRKWGRMGRKWGRTGWEGGLEGGSWRLSCRKWVLGAGSGLWRAGSGVWGGRKWGFGVTPPPVPLPHSAMSEDSAQQNARIRHRAGIRHGSAGGAMGRYAAGGGGSMGRGDGAMGRYGAGGWGYGALWVTVGQGMGL